MAGLWRARDTRLDHRLRAAAQRWSHEPSRSAALAQVLGQLWTYGLRPVGTGLAAEAMRLLLILGAAREGDVKRLRGHSRDLQGGTRCGTNPAAIARSTGGAPAS